MTLPRLRLWTEFCGLFIGVPMLMAAFFGQYSLFAVIWLLAGVAAALLAMTPGWRFGQVLRGPVLGEWRLIAAFFLITAAVCLAFVLTIDPDRLLSMPRHNPALWMLIMVAYPIASALPQELIYRSLFFERYGGLFPGRWAAVVANGAAFGVGHMFYESWVTISMTAAGGAIMGWAYTRHRSMLLAWVLHALAGQLIFTLGLGSFFYHGAVGR